MVIKAPQHNMKILILHKYRKRGRKKKALDRIPWGG